MQPKEPTDMDMRNGQANEYRTGDFYRAAYLVTNQHEIREIRRISTDRVQFVFDLNDEIVALLRKYDAHGAVVPVHEFVTAQKLIKTEMYKVISPCAKKTDL